MHRFAVYLLCLLAARLVWQNGAELLLAWYSGADPPLGRTRLIWACCEMLLAVVAVVLALATL